MNVRNRIQSIRETMAVEYKRPPPENLDKFIDALSKSKKAQEYLKSRGLSDETIEYFKLGYDEEKKAIAIPHFKGSELIWFKYRFIDKDAKPKYIAEPNCETYVFHDVGLQIAKDKGGILIVEGEFDAMMAWQKGFKNVISPAAGKDSYAIWIEELNPIKRIWIAYDNDVGGNKTARELAERIGVEKTLQVKYPEGIKDANEFLLKNSVEDMRRLIASATPFYKYEFSGVSEIVRNIIEDPHDYMTTTFLPGVRIERDQLIVLSGATNSNKTGTALNIALELSGNDKPVLVMPFERGVYSVGKRFIQIATGKTQEDMEFTSKDEWSGIMSSLSSLPVYFAVPDRSKITETISRAKRLFGVKMVVIDHLDYVIRNLAGNRENAISDTMRDLKRVAEETGVAILVVTHIRKLAQGENISLDALKGSSSLSQDPEVVALLHHDRKENYLEVDIAKNKGAMVSRRFNVNVDVGIIVDDYYDF